MEHLIKLHSTRTLSYRRLSNTIYGTEGELRIQSLSRSQLSSNANFVLK